MPSRRGAGAGHGPGPSRRRPGVSIATVSRVLNQPGNVAPQTRELVEQAVERLGARAPGPRGGLAETRRRGGLRPLPVRAHRLLRPDRVLDRRDPRTPRPPARPECGRGCGQHTQVLSQVGRRSGDRRRDLDPAAGVERRTGPPASPALPFRRGRPAYCAAARHRVRLGRALRRRPPGDSAHLVEPRTPPHRRDRRATGVAGQRRAAERSCGRTGRRRHPSRPRTWSGTSNRPREQGYRAAARVARSSSAPDRTGRLQRQGRRRRFTGCRRARPRGPDGPVRRRLRRHRPEPRHLTRHSPRSANPCRRWAGWQSACSSAYWTATNSKPCTSN